MSRLHPTLADGRPEGPIHRATCASRVRIEVQRRKAMAALFVPSRVSPSPFFPSRGKPLPGLYRTSKGQKT
jgi:hypothetical protein